MDVSSYSDEDLYRLWEERSGVYEFDGGLSREDAQHRAAMDMKGWLVPRKLPDAIEKIANWQPLGGS
jgi:hypothetical protein